MNETGEFHAKDGWFFKRLPDGSVRMRKYKAGGPDEDGTSTEAEHEVVMDSNTWCSVMASVSPPGDTADNHQAAMKFHGVV